MANQLLRLRCHGNVLLNVLGQGKRVPTTLLSKRPLTNANDNKETKEDASKGDLIEKISVVDTPPVYTKKEAEEIEEVINRNASRAGSRTEYVNEREPVVVHEMSYPISTNKWYRVVPESDDFIQVGKSHIKRVPKLEHGLERVLFSPGVHCLEDPHSGVYNFDPYIRNITQPDEFDYEKLTPYITSSKDKALINYARNCKKRFVGSTSSMTHVLSHLYFAISAGKRPDISSLSMAFADMPTNFTRGMRYPASIALRYHDGVYGIDADKSFDVKDSILSILGKSLEKLLTSSPKEFEMYKKQNSWKVKEIPEENYHYTKFDEFVLRSQLDCRDDRLPRKTFDLKTRGSLAIRMDIQNYEISKGYQIKTMKGRMQSFEREYYDMVRSAFLKYNFQTRIGNMDGIFVAYHNTARMFGFQYISRREMDNVIFGNESTGNKAFKSVLILLGKLLRTITDQFSKQDIRVTFDSTSGGGKLGIWVEVVNDQAEEAAAQQYEELGIFNPKAMRSKRKKQQTMEAENRDPFATSDPLDKSNLDKVAQEELDDELDDVEPDPMDYIYVNDKQPIMYYVVETFSTYMDQDTDSPVTVKNMDEEWYINWKLTKERLEPAEMARRYRRLRLRQATYFERASPDTPEEDLSPMIKILRRISRRDLWRNREPRGKVIVNRSRLPNARVIRASVASDTNQALEEKTEEDQSAKEKSKHLSAKRQESGRSKKPSTGSTTKNTEKRRRKPKSKASDADGVSKTSDASNKSANSESSPPAKSTTGHSKIGMVKEMGFRAQKKNKKVDN
ncbi:hypothetical protein J3B02_001100 [Coemansia erecta]|uniref:Uncharacterized protein n=1 Tax=Coemansia asiatica TaxID=1052880 RepID=A0A9W7XMW7_9FUNG|nr:hypothetical protein LPJ64_001975 [Coemansia asiatica]KAJ2857291.1 hypothetical protein J3B02_001100 [Coemansia erecta]KAJ2889059.1 hypothetical protein FB639_000178 [Coemansia asiatica]